MEIMWDPVKNPGTVCPGSSDPFYVVTYYIKWVTTSWTHSTFNIFVIKFTIKTDDFLSLNNSIRKIAASKNT